MRNLRRIERYEAKTNGDDPFSPVLRRWTVASSRQTLRSKNLETRWATGLNSRYRERKHRLSSCLYLSVPFSLSPPRFPPSPLPSAVFLHLSISLPLAHAPSLFFFADKFSRLPFTTLPADSTRQSHAKRCYWPRICRNNCYDYRAEISFMNLDFFYVSVLISIGKEFSIGPGTGFTGAEL